MGTLQSRLQEDVKDAMRAKDKARTQVLRMLVNDLKQEQMRVGRDELSESEEFAVLRKSAKMRKDAIEGALQSGREEFAEKERGELALIEGYLPGIMNESETEEKVRELLAELGIESRKEQGRFMKEWMARHRDTSDGKLVNQILGKLLG